MKFIPILDPGHGAYYLGHDTSLKVRRSPKGHTPIFYEGASNRGFASRIKEYCDLNNIPSILLNNDTGDTPLLERVNRIEDAAEEILTRFDEYFPFLISIHSNGGGGHGFEVFTSPGETLSDRIATEYCNQIKKLFPLLRLRTDYADGDPDKEARFTVLTKTTIPAILTENLFMDNKADLTLLRNDDIRSKIALAHFKMIKNLYKNGLSK